MNNDRIPKVIHYCWFGNKKYPRIVKKCIRSWKKYCRDYTFIEWNENNFDVTLNSYTKRAYDAKKWAFVSDYVRLWSVYHYGGIYLDTDVELIKNIDSLLHYDAFFGFEGEYPDKKHYINTGLGFGATKKHTIIRLLLDEYDENNFGGDISQMINNPCPLLNREVFIKFGIKMDGKTQTINNVRILDRTYLCPVMFSSLKKNFTNNTISIHHYIASWKEQDDVKKEKTRLRHSRYKTILARFLGQRITYRIISLFRKTK